MNTWRQSTDNLQVWGRETFLCGRTTPGSTRFDLGPYILDQISHSSLIVNTEWLHWCCNKSLMIQSRIVRYASLSKITWWDYIDFWCKPLSKCLILLPNQKSTEKHKFKYRQFFCAKNVLMKKVQSRTLYPQLKLITSVLQVILMVTVLL